jgi:hypothetical protein
MHVPRRWREELRDLRDSEHAVRLHELELLLHVLLRRLALRGLRIAAAAGLVATAAWLLVTRYESVAAVLVDLEHTRPSFVVLAVLAEVGSIACYVALLMLLLRGSAAERGGIYIVDLAQTQQRLDQVQAFVRGIGERGGSVLFVGTKAQARASVRDEARRVGMPYVNHRWLGGLLTNWTTMSGRVQRLHELRSLKQESQLELLPAKQRISMEAALEKLAATDWVIPGNDDAVRSCALVVKALADGLELGRDTRDSNRRFSPRLLSWINPVRAWLVRGDAPR